MGTRTVPLEGFQQAKPKSQGILSPSLKRVLPPQDLSPVNKKMPKTENLSSVNQEFSLFATVDEKLSAEDFEKSMQKVEAMCSDDQASPVPERQVNKNLVVNIGSTEGQSPTTNIFSPVPETALLPQDQSPVERKVLKSMQGKVFSEMVNSKESHSTDSTAGHIQHGPATHNNVKSAPVPERVLLPQDQSPVKRKVLKSVQGKVSSEVVNSKESHSTDSTAGHVQHGPATPDNVKSVHATIKRITSFFEESLRKETPLYPRDQPKVIPDVYFGEEFQPIHWKKRKIEDNLPVVPHKLKETACTEFGINVRDDGPGPREDSSLFNIQRKDVLCDESAVVPYKPGNIVSEPDSKELFLPSQTGGFLILEHLKPSSSGMFEENSEFMKISEVGKGAHGIVELCRHLHTEKEFIRKRISSKSFRMAEVEILHKLAHDNIVKLYGFRWHDGIPEIFMENCGHSLLKFAMSPGTGQLLTEERIIEITRQGLKGLEFLAIHKVLHLDIKPENLCVQWRHGNLVVKFTDFGTAHLPHDPLTLKDCNITVEYASPELCRQLYPSLCCKQPQPPPVEGDNSVTTQTDMYSWGMTLLFLYLKYHVMVVFITNGKKSYKHLEPGEINSLRRDVLELVVSKPDMVKQLLIPDVCTPDMKALLSQMLEGRPDRRITPAAALQKLEEMRRSRARLIHPKPKESVGYQHTQEKDVPPPRGNIPNLAELL